MSKTNEDYFYDNLIYDSFDESHPYPGKCYKDPFWVCEYEPITLQEYADRRCISYETVRRQVKKYRADLIPHIRKVGKTQYLDNNALDYLVLFENFCLYLILVLPFLILSLNDA